MTKREFYTAIVNGEVTDEVITFATQSIEKLDATNAKRAAKAAEKKADNSALSESVVALLTKEPMTLASLIEKINAAGLTRADDKVFNNQFVARLLKPFVDEGTVVKSTVKADKKAVVAYCIG